MKLPPSVPRTSTGTRAPWRIKRAWKQGSGGYRLGATKTKKSRRTINVPKSVLDKLDFGNEWLFVNRAGGPVRAQGFSARVWAPAVERAWPSVDDDGEPGERLLEAPAAHSRLAP